MSHLGNEQALVGGGMRMAAEPVAVGGASTNPPAAAGAAPLGCQHPHYALLDGATLTALTPSLRLAETHVRGGGDVVVCTSGSTGTIDLERMTKLDEFERFSETEAFRRHASVRGRRLRREATVAGHRRNCQHMLFILYRGMQEERRFFEATTDLTRAHAYGVRGGSWALAVRDQEGTIRLQDDWMRGPSFVRPQRSEQSGFTLIELMMVVAIIGILSISGMARAGWMEQLAYVPLNLEWDQVHKGIMAFQATSEVNRPIEKWQGGGVLNSGVYDYNTVASLACRIGTLPLSGHKFVPEGPLSPGCQELGIGMDGPRRGYVQVAPILNHDIVFLQGYRVSPASRTLYRVTYYKRKGTDREFSCIGKAEGWSQEGNVNDFSEVYGRALGKCA